jgi:putative endonuclease
MKYLYVIRSEINGNLYVGICKNILTRLKEHNMGKNRYTKGLKPWELVYTESFPNWQKAREKEKYYKSGIGKEYLKRILVP